MHATTRRDGRQCRAPTACVPRALRNRDWKAEAAKAKADKAAAAKAAADKAAAEKAAAEKAAEDRAAFFHNLLNKCGQCIHAPAAQRAEADKVAQQARIADVADEPLELMGPITGVMKCVRLSLMDAAAASGVEDIDAHAFMASEAGAQLAAADPHGLDADEAGALWLYTAQSDFYPTLNRLLRTRDRSALKPFFPYLQLMLTARSKLPKYNSPVWRGVKGVDLRAQYPKDKEVWWWAFSSTTKQLHTLTNPMFLGTSGVRTVFMIEIVHGVDLQRYSAFQGVASEAEVLLYPGTKLKVVGAMEMGGGLFQVHLREVPLTVAVFK